jgi:hypothetical protein
MDRIPSLTNCIRPIKFTMLIERTPTGYSAFSQPWGIITTGKDMPALRANTIEVRQQAQGWAVIELNYTGKVYIRAPLQSIDCNVQSPNQIIQEVKQTQESISAAI